MDKYSYEKSSAWLQRAEKVLAGGVSSEFRKYNHPHAIFYTKGKGSHVYDVDGNDYLDFTLSQGPLILGHSHPKVLQAINEYSEQGQLFAGQHIKEVELAEKLNSLIPSAELMRFCLDGSTAVHTALRVARAKTKRKKFLRFEGHYHGWLDNVAWGYAAPAADALGSREHPVVFPWSEGLPENAKEEFILLPWNDLELLRKVVTEHFNDIAAIITEPVMCNNGCIPPKEGFLQGLREICSQFGIALIFDEVITGFRLGLGGAQQYFGIIPDLAIFAKAMGSGYPISAIVGKKEWMQLIEKAKVIHAGTMNSGNATVAASLATIEVLEKEDPYERMFCYGEKLKKGLQQAAVEAGQNLLVQGVGPIVHSGFTQLSQVNDYRDTFSYDKVKLGQLIAGLHNRGVRVIGRGLWYISAAHTEKEIDVAINTATEVLQEMKR
ncbi:aspartate aminotransferase family protein [Niabella soli]|uniref:Aminotransferase class III n=1 Tax=Niabella soli DSM 19437 TaxID=929713 RepID=W0F430_9BACT|nr:aspartate aminotransferase family protein [Niabella soli]AHF16199.1 aminotransferase class III [Niabella soli DSM 19437]